MSHKPKSPPEEILPDFDARTPGYSREKWMEEYRRLNAPREEWFKAALARREKKPAKVYARKATAYEPRYFTDTEIQAVVAHVGEKFEMLARRKGRTIRIGSLQVRLKRLSERAMRYHLGELGVDPDDVEGFIAHHLDAQDEFPEHKRAIEEIMQEWAPWFFRELSGVKIFEITERAMPKPRRRAKSAVFPLRVAAKVTRALIEKHYTDGDGLPLYGAGLKQIGNLLTKWRAHPIAPNPPVTYRQRRTKYEGHYCPKCRTSPCACARKT